MCLPQQQCIRSITVDSEPSVSRRFRKRQERSYSKGRDKVTLDRNYFILYFSSDKISHYKTYDFRKFFIPEAFKHVGLQNTFNRCEVHHILSLMVNYPGFLVKCINHQNVMCPKKIHFLQNFARVMIDHCFLQESCKILEKMPLHPRILQELNFFVRIMPDLARNKFSVN